MPFRFGKIWVRDAKEVHKKNMEEHLARERGMRAAIAKFTPEQIKEIDADYHGHTAWPNFPMKNKTKKKRP